MPFADRGNSTGFRYDVVFRRLIGIERPFGRSCRENAGSEYGADDDADAARLTERKVLIESRLIQQRVGHRHQEIVEIAVLEKPWDQASEVHTGADRLDLSGRPQLIECGISAAIYQLPEAGFDPFFIPLVPPIEIVYYKGVDRIDPEALQALLARAQNAIARIVEPQIEVQPVLSSRKVEAGRVRGPRIDTTDLGGETEVGPRALAQEVSNAMLALGVTVPGRCVEHPNTGIIRGPERGFRLCLANNLIRITERASTQSEFRNLEGCTADPALR